MRYMRESQYLSFQLHIIDKRIREWSNPFPYAFDKIIDYTRNIRPITMAKEDT